MPHRPIRVLHLVNSLEPGGMENGVVNLARHLPPEEFATGVCCLEREGAFAARLPATTPVFVLGKGGGFSLAAARRLRETLARERPDVLHTHNLGPLIYAALATRGGFGPAILQGEHAQLAPEELSPKRLWQRRVLFRCARCVHTVSSSLRDDLRRAGLPGGHVEVLLNGVDTGRFQPGDRAAARQQTGLPAEAVILGMVGRFGPFKRHALLVEAFHALGQRLASAHLLIVGAGGPEEANVRAQAAGSPLAGRIHFTGLQRDLRPFYQAMDLLVVPSVNEGLSNTLLEAMASGVPALAHDACGNAEVITPGVDGVVAALESPGRLAVLLEELLRQPARLVEMGRNARAKAERDYSLERMMAGYAALYRRLAGATPRP
jgi:glycosyltransferase involved in cell wall biosynthesis